MPSLNDTYLKLGATYPQFITRSCSRSGWVHYPRSFCLVMSKRNVTVRFKLGKRDKRAVDETVIKDTFHCELKCN